MCKIAFLKKYSHIYFVDNLIFTTFDFVRQRRLLVRLLPNIKLTTINEP